MVKKIELILVILLVVLVPCFANAASETPWTIVGDQSGMTTGLPSGVTADPPVASPGSDSYAQAQSVTLTTAGGDHNSIRYTLDSTTPDCPSTGKLYSGAISITSSKTLKAVACYTSSDSVASTVSTYTYTITSGGGGGGGGGASAPPSMPTTTDGQVTATASAGGQTTLTTEDETKVTVKVPAGAVSANTVINVEETDKGTIMIAAPSPQGKTAVSTFSITATVNGQPVTQFFGNVTITISYTDEQVAGLDPTTLKIYRWTGSQWVALSTTVNTTTKTITATTSSFSNFAVMGETTDEPEEEVEEVEEVIEPEKPTTEMTADELVAEITRLTAILNQLKAQIALLLGEAEVPDACLNIAFDRNLSQGDVGNDVKCLQALLNQSADTQVAASGVGSPGRETNYFGSLTKSAVIKFQNKYQSDILAPWGLTQGTGYVGQTTIAKLNELLGR